MRQWYVGLEVDSWSLPFTREPAGHVGYTHPSDQELWQGVRGLTC